MEMKGLKTIRKQKKYSQLKVAFALSISREALSHYENGKRSPDIDMLLKMSDYFDVSIHYLVTGEEFTPKIPQKKKKVSEGFFSSAYSYKFCSIAVES